MKTVLFLPNVRNLQSVKHYSSFTSPSLTTIQKNVRSASAVTATASKKDGNPGSGHHPELPESSLAPSQLHKSHLSIYEVEKIHQLNVNPSLKTYYKKPLMLTQGSMQYVYDQEGKRYLDMFGGIVTTSVGHCHPKLVDAMKTQLGKLWHTSAIHLNEEMHNYAVELISKFPEPLSNVFFCNSGSEANDLAVLMARLFTGSFDVVAIKNAYHGASPYNMGLCGISSWRYNLPTALGYHHTTCPDVYSGRFGGSKCRDSVCQVADRGCSCATSVDCAASDAYIEDLESVLHTTVALKGPAAMIAESIQGVGGVVQFPKNYLKKAQALLKKKNALLIMDEVQTGFGRTGRNYWGFHSHKVTPDIVTLAKGIGNGFPLAAVVTRPEIAAVMADALHFNTFGGNPLASTAGSAVLKIIDEESMKENSKILGAKFMVGMTNLMKHHEDLVGDVRGQGLMIGIEMITVTPDDHNEKTKGHSGHADISRPISRSSKRPMPTEEFNWILEDLKEMGLIVGRGGSHGNVFRISPPMCISEADVDFALDAFETAFRNHHERKARDDGNRYPVYYE